MNRRDAFLLLTSGAICAVPPALAHAFQDSNLTSAEFERLLRELLRVEPMPGEAERVRRRLMQPKIDFDSDPRLQPAIGFNPEVEL